MESSDGHTIRISLLEGEVSIQLSENRSVFFRSTELHDLNYSQYDFALLVAFVCSLTTGEKFYLDYPVTESALRQFDNYSRALRILSPGRFKIPQVICSNVISEQAKHTGSNKRIVTLSGGIDSTYGAASSMLKDARFTHCLLIKGFDYPLDNTTGFNELRRRVENIANEIGLQLVVVETNLKTEISSYGMQHTGGLSCCLHLMAGAGFESGAYAADLTPLGDVLQGPWGNCMGIASSLTTDQFPIAYLGSECGRGDKVRWLAERKPDLFHHLSVCYKDKSVGGNCGKCEKCARTRVALMAIPDLQLRRDVEISLFGSVSDYRAFFGLIADRPKSLGRLFDLSASLPDCEARQLLNDKIDKILMIEKGIYEAAKRKRGFRSLAGKFLRVFKR